MTHEGYVIWLTGISGSGKTTLGKGLYDVLCKRYSRVEFIDGDSVRSFFEDDLGYSRAERIMNVKRIAFAARLLALQGVQVVVANIAPYYEVRDFIRRHSKNYIQIYCEISLADVQKRDVKGHYARYAQGELTNLLGLDDTYDIPRTPDCIVHTGCETIEDSLQRIMACLETRMKD